MKKLITKEDIINNQHNYKIQQMKDKRLHTLLKRGTKKGVLSVLFFILLLFLFFISLCFLMISNNKIFYYIALLSFVGMFVLPFFIVYTYVSTTIKAYWNRGASVWQSFKPFAWERIVWGWSNKQIFVYVCFSLLVALIIYILKLAL